MLPYILGTPFLDRHVLSKQPSERRINLTGFSHGQIVRHLFYRGLKRATRSESINAGPDRKVRKDRASRKNKLPINYVAVLFALPNRNGSPVVVDVKADGSHLFVPEWHENQSAFGLFP